MEPKKKTIKQRVLDILLDFQPHHASKFIPITHRFSAVMERLKKEDGYKIDTLYLDGRNKAAWYQLVALPVVA
ncbi:MAG TPA: hypothetical protein V6D50_08135 [Chroococcales cyanobacterium]|jgi:hypothetical protein